MQKKPVSRIKARANVSPPPKTTSRHELRDELYDLKRERILETAARLFAENGYRSTSLTAIAEAMSATKPFIYYHFENKEDILRNLLDRTMSSVLAALSSVDIEKAAPKAALGGLIRAFVLIVIETRNSTGIFWRGIGDVPELDRDKAVGFRHQFEKPFLTVLRRGLDSGEFEFPDLNLMMLSIEGMINWIHVWYRPDGRLTKEELAAHMSHMVNALVGARRE